MSPSSRKEEPKKSPRLFLPMSRREVSFGSLENKRRHRGGDTRCFPRDLGKRQELTEFPTQEDHLQIQECIQSGAPGMDGAVGDCVLTLPPPILMTTTKQSSPTTSPGDHHLSRPYFIGIHKDKTQLPVEKVLGELLRMVCSRVAWETRPNTHSRRHNALRALPPPFSRM